MPGTRGIASKSGVVERQSERRHLVSLLAGEPQRLAAGGKHHERRAGPEELGR
jgi:hypothetical protein